VAKLADALDLGSSVRKDVWVQVPPSAPSKKDPQLAGLFTFNSLVLLPERTRSCQSELRIDDSGSTATGDGAIRAWSKRLY
jgi:hypothetical protein